MNTKHTPGPWVVEQQADTTPVITYQARDIAVIETAHGDSKANAAFIVRACNAHDDLLAALAKCVDALLNVPVVGGIYDQQHSDTHMRATLDARAAIAKATGNG